MFTALPTGTGYTCLVCGAWVTSGESHDHGKILQVEPSLVDPQLLAALSRIEELLTRIEHNTDPEWQRR